MKEIFDMSLFAMDKCTENQILKEPTMTKRSMEYKGMSRGTSKNTCIREILCKGWKWRWHWLNGSIGTLFIASPLIESLGKQICGTGYHRGGGYISPTPNIYIAIKQVHGLCEKKKHMQKLHCNATVMGLNWWWLNLLSYLRDVCTKNALVLYRLSMKN